MIFGIDRAGPDAGYPDDLVGKPIVYIAWNHSGSADDVERDTAGLRVGPTPVTTTIASVPYLEVQTAHDLAFAWGGRSFIKSQNGNDVRSRGARRARRARRDRAGGGELLDHRPRWRDRARSRGRDGLCRSSVRRSTSARTRHWSDPALDEANVDWCRRVMAVVEPDSRARRLCERQCRRRPGGDAPVLRRREARAPGRAEA